MRVHRSRRQSEELLVITKMYDLVREFLRDPRPDAPHWSRDSMGADPHSSAKKAAISRANRSGSSIGAKCPPRGIGVQRRTHALVHHIAGRRDIHETVRGFEHAGGHAGGMVVAGLRRHHAIDGPARRLEIQDGDGGGDTFSDTNSSAYWMLFEPDGIPRSFTPTGGGGCTNIGSAGGGGGSIYVTGTRRDYAVVLTPLGLIRLHIWDPNANGGSGQWTE